MSRGNWILAFIFVVLLILTVVLENPFGQSVYEESEKASSPLFPSFIADHASKLEIRQGEGEPTILQKNAEGQWVVASQHGYKAQEGRVKTLLSKIGTFRNTDLIEDSPSDLDAPYNLGKKGIEVKIADASGNLLAGFVQGKLEGNPQDPDYQRRASKLPAYLRKLDSKEVYLVQGFSPIVPTAKEWLDTSLARFDANKVSEIHLQGKLVEGEISLKKEGEEWKLIKPEEAPAKKEVAAAMARSFSSAYFKEFVGPLDDAAKFGLNDPQLKVSMKLENGEELLLQVGRQLDDQSYFATKGEKEPFVFQVHSYTVDALKKTVVDLKYVPPAPIEAPKTEVPVPPEAEKTAPEGEKKP